MNVTFVLPSYPLKPWGGFRVVYEYSNHLVARGHKVTVVHPRRLKRKPRPSAPNLYRLLRQKVATFRNEVIRPNVQQWQPIDPRVRFSYVSDLSSDHVPDADAVFATAWTTAEYVADYPVSKGEKFYLIQSYETWDGPKDRVDATWKMPFHKVVIAGWLHDLGSQMGCQDMAKIQNGFDHSKFKVLTPIFNRPKRAAMMFSQVELKGSADGLIALKKAKTQYTDLQVVMFGVSPLPKSLPAWIEYHRHPTPHELVEGVYNSASIFLCPSWIEGFALPPAEAMACGCAVASTDCGGVREFAEDSVTALLSPPRDPEALANNLLRLLEDDDLRIRIAMGGHKRIQAFTWERSTNLLEEYIKSHLVEGKHKPCSGVTKAIAKAVDESSLGLKNPGLP